SHSAWIRDRMEDGFHPGISRNHEPIPNSDVVALRGGVPRFRRSRMASRGDGAQSINLWDVRRPLVYLRQRSGVRNGHTRFQRLCRYYRGFRGPRFRGGDFHDPAARVRFLVGALLLLLSGCTGSAVTPDYSVVPDFHLTERSNRPVARKDL